MRTSVHLVVGNGGVQIDARRGRRDVWEAVIESRSPEELPAALTEVLVSHPESKEARATITICPPWVQLRTLREIPPISSRDLVSLLRGRPGRFFRRDGGPLVIDG